MVRTGDKVSVRAGSTKKPVFATLSERLSKFQSPAWLKVDAEKHTIEVQGAPKLNPAELMFDIGQVLEFYSR
jgi:ribosomal protein S4